MSNALLIVTAEEKISKYFTNMLNRLQVSCSLISTYFTQILDTRFLASDGSTNKIIKAKDQEASTRFSQLESETTLLSFSEEYTCKKEKFLNPLQWDFSEPTLHEAKLVSRRMQWTSRIELM